MSMYSVRRVAAAAALIALFAASSPAAARDLRSEPLERPGQPAGKLLAAALSLLDGFWSQVSAALTGDNGAGIDPNGATVPVDNGPGIDPNGLLGDNGAGIDPNG